MSGDFLDGTMIGVIIAAGRGERLVSIAGEKPKTLVEINGKPLIHWIMKNLKAVGIDQFILVTGFNHEKIEAYFVEHDEGDVRFVYNESWERGNGISVLSVADHLHDDVPFLLAMSDHLIGKEALGRLMEMKHECPLLLVDPNPKKVFDIEDATKVKIEGKSITDIGKNIGEYNGVDAGVFLLDDRIFPHLRNCIEKGQESLSAGIKAMIEEHVLSVCPIPDGEYWIDIDSKDAYNNALKMWRFS